MEMLIVAKIMKHAIERTKLFKLLRDKGFLMEGNIPFQPYVDNKDLDLIERLLAIKVI